MNYLFTYVESSEAMPAQLAAVQAARELTSVGTLDEACYLATVLNVTIALRDATGSKRGIVQPNEDWRLF